MDSDLHTMEPDGLWEHYLAEPFKKFARRFRRASASSPNQPVIQIGELELGEMSKRPRTAIVGEDRHRRAFARSPHYEIAHARGYDPESHVQAMDIEGIDVAVLYGTRGAPGAHARRPRPRGGRGAGPRAQRLDNCAPPYNLA